MSCRWPADKSPICRSTRQDPYGVRPAGAEAEQVHPVPRLPHLHQEAVGVFDVADQPGAGSRARATSTRPWPAWRRAPARAGCRRPDRSRRAGCAGPVPGLGPGGPRWCWSRRTRRWCRRSTRRCSGREKHRCRWTTRPDRGPHSPRSSTAPCTRADDSCDDRGFLNGHSVRSWRHPTAVRSAFPRSAGGSRPAARYLLGRARPELVVDGGKSWP